MQGLTIMDTIRKSNNSYSLAVKHDIFIFNLDNFSSAILRKQNMLRLLELSPSWP